MTKKQVDQPEIGLSVDAGGIKTNYHDVGEGEPVVLIHGSGPGVTAWANWRFTLPELSRSFRVLAPDMYGFGYTEFPSEPIRDMKVWIDHLVSFLDTMKLERVNLIGNSFGGALALAFLIAHPDRVKRAVLMGAAGLDFEITEGLDYVWGYEPSVDNMRRAVKYLSHDQSRITEDLIRSRYEASVREGVWEAYNATFGAEPRQNQVRMLTSSEADIASISHEVMIIHGRDDQVLPSALAPRLNSLIPNSDAHILGNCGHWVQIERAATFNLLVKDFFRNGLASGS
jgi:2-hydroxymuconate-semialdehyde hydrolase